MRVAARKPDRERLMAMLMVLIGAAFAAFANVWPESAVLDDQFFVGSRYYSGLGDFVLFFTADAWAVYGFDVGHYRPLLLMSIWLDAMLYGDWMVGYRFSNILLHVLVTVSVFGFVRRLLEMSRDGRVHSLWYAFLAALVFAVHPIHTEVVNSVFNRSEMLVTLSGMLGLWWFLSRFENNPAVAWGGLALAYLLAMLAKESGVVLPGIAVVLVLILGRGDTRNRLRKCLPALWLLIPLGLYLFLRAQALAETVPAESVQVTGFTGPSGLENFAHVPEWHVLLQAAGVWAQSLKALIWPHPLLLYPLRPAGLWLSAGLLLQAALIVVAFIQARRARYGLIMGLAIFYIAILPASRIIGTPGELPHLAARYLYFPSVGLTVSLAFLLGYLERRLRPGVALLPVIAAVLVLTPLCWARNADWLTSVALYESEYRNGSRSAFVLQKLTAEHLHVGNNARVAEICDAHVNQHQEDGKFSNQCAVGYTALGRSEDAERAFLEATQHENARAQAHSNLAFVYLREGRRSEAIHHFEQAVDAETAPAMRAVRKGEMVAWLHRGERDRLIEARDHFNEALLLDPGLDSARRWKRTLDRMIDSP